MWTVVSAARGTTHGVSGQRSVPLLLGGNVIDPCTVIFDRGTLAN